MPRAPQAKPDNPAQSKRFIETAQEIGASEHAEDFDKAFDKIAPSKPTTAPKTKPE
jgi:hypothetical protein